ncbi:MAG TPA: hypothetical protein VJB14_03660 [Planctomycetota bacterium]|nr:hypothetical protein [Planctomycetota bacterium]
MGREIVYCFKCQSRLNGDDFDNGKAYRVGDKATCGECVFDLVADLPAEEQEAILNPPKKKPSSTQMKATSGAGTQMRRTGSIPTTTRTGSTGKIPVTTGTRSIPKKGATRSIPKADPPPEEEISEGDEDPSAKKKKVLLIAGGGGGLLVIVIVLLAIAFSGSDPKKGAAEEVPLVKQPSTTRKGAPDTGMPQAVKTVIMNAIDFAKNAPADLAGQWKKWKEAEETCKGTKFEGEPGNELAKLKTAIEKEFAAFDKQNEEPLKAEWPPYKKILDGWTELKNRYDLDELRVTPETRITQIQEMFEERFNRAKRDVRVCLDGKDLEKKSQIVIASNAWGFPGKTADLEALTLEADAPLNPNVKTPDTKAPVARPLSPEMKAFMPKWNDAILPAFTRDFDTATANLNKAARDSESTEVKKAVADDVEDLAKIAKLIEEAKKSAAAVKRLSTATFEVQDGPAEWKKITGKVMKVDAQRIELATDNKEKPRVFVELTDLGAATIADHVKKDAASERLAAMLCLLEGNVEAATKIVKQASKVPDRYWQIAKEIREKASKLSSREFEARNLFHAAELAWREIRTRGEALDKYKLLSGDYAGTVYIRRNQGAIASRAEVGREYVFFPADLRTPGAMNTFKLSRKYAPKAEQAIVTNKEIDFQACVENYVQIEFYALPNTNYRCWLYVGGCCVETMTFYYQMSEGKVSDRGKEKSIEPGGRAIDTFIPGIVSFPKEHAKHKPKDPKALHPKEPTRWEWVELRLPKPYAAPGAKEIRLFTEQPGLGIAYCLISSTRPTAPDLKVKAELDKELAAAPQVPVLKGTPEPKEWLAIGPFPEALATSQGPETDIDLTKDLKGKTAQVKWKTVNATVNGQEAVFAWDKNGQFTPKDNVSVYALIHVKVPVSTAGQLFLGHDDGCRVWLRGNLVHNLNTGGAVKSGEHKVKVQLDEGWNRILVKVRNGTGGFGFAMKIVDAAGKEIPGLEYNAFGDELENN